MKRALACALAAGATVAACGGSAGVAPLAAGDATGLRHHLAVIRARAAADDPAGAHAAASSLKAYIDRLLRASRLSAADGRLMLTALAEVDDRISVEVHAAPPPAAPATPAPAPAPRSAPGPGKGHGHDHNGGDGGD